MASANFLEEALSTDVDESAVSALVGSLEDQLAPPVSTPNVNAASLNQNHVHSAISNGGTALPSQKHGAIANGDTINSIAGNVVCVGHGENAGSVPPAWGTSPKRRVGAHTALPLTHDSRAMRLCICGAVSNLHSSLSVRASLVMPAGISRSAFVRFHLRDASNIAPRHGFRTFRTALHYTNTNTI